MIERSGRNLDERNECSLAGESGKQEKQWFPVPSLLSCESLVSVKEKKEERKKEKNTHTTQTKLNPPRTLGIM